MKFLQFLNTVKYSGKIDLFIKMISFIENDLRYHSIYIRECVWEITNRFIYFKYDSEKPDEIIEIYKEYNFYKEHDSNIFESKFQELIEELIIQYYKIIYK